ncbi:MAG: hypothetical protein ACJ76I_14185 [Gaiellaceae bacterium]
MLARKAAFVLAQWVAVVALVGFSVRGLLIAGTTAVLVVTCADELGGRAAGTVAGVFWIGAPALLPFWRSDFEPHWRHEVLPVLYGARDSWRALAGVAVLLAILAALRWTAAAAAVVVASVLACALRSFSWSELSISLSRIREVGWSVRVVEYVPLAGLVGVAVRRPRTVVPVLAAFVATAVWPLAHDRGMTKNTVAAVPGLPLYAVLAGCLVLLVPAQWRARAYAHAWARPSRRASASSTP